MPSVSNIVVVGASAGGVASLQALTAGLPSDFHAAVFIVLHISPEYVSHLPQILSNKGPLPAVHPKNGDPIRPGHIYVAPPDHHLLLEGECIGVRKGPKENRFRPSVDALFRSAAYTYKSSVIGVVLSGALDDGTSGLWTIKRLGGISVVQDPEDATFDSMPLSALNQVEIDYSLPASDIGPLLGQLIKIPAHKQIEISAEEKTRLETEIGIAGNGHAFESEIMKIGTLTPFTCPECHGTLMEFKEGNLYRYRCHTGHGYTAHALLNEVSGMVEDGFWSVIRALQEAVMLLKEMGKKYADIGQTDTAEQFFEKASDAEQRALILEKMTFNTSNINVHSLQV
ncbi:MAG: chemotaxis protein CheB [Pseudomonadota bacterium]